MDPRNGLALNALHDKAFDRGLVSFDSSGKMLVSSRLKKDAVKHADYLIQFEQKPIQMPSKFKPSPEALAYHREHIFQP
jgi:Predicted restriction endonuclease